jgi:hypothetical protein
MQTVSNHDSRALIQPKKDRNDKLQTKEETEVQDNLSGALVVFVERPLVLGLVQPEPSRNVLI